jgi:hypothetical protein
MTGGDPESLAIEGQFTHSSAPETGSFESSNKLLNQIQTLIRMAIRSNMQSVLTDCPHREKLGWLEEAHLVAPSIFFSYDAAGLYAKILHDVADAQRQNGLVPDIAPEYTVFEGGFVDSPEWGSVAVIAPWLAYQWYGDKEILRSAYPVMQRYVDYLDSTAKDGIISHGLGDWYDIGPKDPGPSQLTPNGITATGFQYENLALLQEIARVLDRHDDALQYHRRAERLRTIFNREFLHADHYATGSQTANALPLVFGITPDESRAPVLENLVRDIRSRSNRTSAGDIGYRYVIRALTDAGRSDVLYALATETGAPSYGDQFRKGATTLTEAWDCNPASSQNHFMLGHILEWFYTGLAGIAPDPAAPGFERVLIKPQPTADLTWVNSHYDSIRGRIVSNWKHANGVFTLHVRIPGNTTATVYLPGEVIAGKQAEGVKLLREESQHTLFVVGSGQYTFASKL